MKDRLMRLFNANPWHKHIGDCAVRAIVIGLGFDYRAACRQLGVACKSGHGLTRSTGIDLYDIKTKFSEFFDVIEDFEQDSNFVPDEFKGSEDDLMVRRLEASLDVPGALGITLREFIESHYAGKGKFLVGLVTPDGSNDGHVVYANCEDDYAVDTFTGSLDFYVDSFMRIKHRLPNSDPRHFKLDPVTKRFIV